MSSPEQKPRPAPVMQSAVTEGSASAARARASMSAIIARVRALRESGRSSRITPSLPRRE